MEKELSRVYKGSVETGEQRERDIANRQDLQRHACLDCGTNLSSGTAAVSGALYCFLTSILVPRALSRLLKYWLTQSRKLLSCKRGKDVLHVQRLSAIYTLQARL